MTHANDLAFPALDADSVAGSPILELKHIGLTKREYFAAIAMQGFIASIPNASAETVAKYSVSYADALIEQLNK